MSSDRPSGFRTLQSSKKPVMLAVPLGYDKPEVLHDVNDALGNDTFAVAVSAEPRHSSPTPVAVVVLDGWGKMSLREALLPLRDAHPATVTLAIVTDARVKLETVLDSGFDDCVTWPIRGEELRARVQARLRKPGPTVALVQLDARALTGRCGAVHMKLTSAQFKVLSQLLHAQGAWTTGRELTRVIAGRSQVGTTPVAIHVHALRKKLGAEAWRIQSERLLGYRFEASAISVESDALAKP